MLDNRDLRPATGERGIALIAALLVVLLTSVLAATFITTTIGERSVSSNTHVARASLLTADAGVRTAQQALANMAQTKLDSLFWCAHHEMLHAGQIGLVRRLLGQAPLW